MHILFGKAFLKNRTNLLIVILSIVVIVVVTFIGIYFSRQYILKQAEERIQVVLQEAEALHYYVQKEMHPAMYLLKEKGRLPNEFHSPEMVSSSYITRRVFNQYNIIRKLNNQPLVEYSMASKNPRNKINLADSMEANLITLFNNDSTIKKYTGIISLQGEKQLYYVRPFLRVENKCLKCHGTRENAPKELREYYNWDSGFNLKVGDISAIEIIKTPVVAEMKTSSIIILIIITIAIILVVLIILYSTLSLKEKIITIQKKEIEGSLTKLKDAQNKLVQSEKMASLGVLTAGVAHEINNPLNFINGACLGLTSFFTEKAPQHKEEVGVLLDGLQIGVERVADIVQGLNHFSRDSKSYNDECSLAKIIDNCLLILKDKYMSSIEIDKQYEEDDITIKGNEGKLHQVFINLLSNAIYAIKENGLITIKTQENNNNIIVSIADNGCGIKKEEITKILDPFFTTKEPGEGTGLGLSITYNIIKEHNGDILFESEPDKGTKVILTFPKS